MKKLIIILALISLIFTLTNKEEDYVIIPKDSIRFRIIPNSNSLEDLTMKEKVKTSISSVISDIETSTDIDDDTSDDEYKDLVVIDDDESEL